MAGKDPCGAGAGGGALTEELTGGDRRTGEAGRAASVAEAAAVLPPLPGASPRQAAKES